MWLLCTLTGKYRQYIVSAQRNTDRTLHSWCLMPDCALHMHHLHLSLDKSVCKKNEKVRCTLKEDPDVRLGGEEEEEILKGDALRPRVNSRDTNINKACKTQCTQAELLHCLGSVYP